MATKKAITAEARIRAQTNALLVAIAGPAGPVRQVDALLDAIDRHMSDDSLDGHERDAVVKALAWRAKTINRIVLTAAQRESCT